MVILPFVRLLGQEIKGTNPISRSKQRDYTLLAESIEGQAVPAPHACFFEDVLQVNFHGAGTNPEFLGDFPVLESLFDQFHHLVFSRSQIGSDLSFGGYRLAEYGILHPAATLPDSSQAG